jgi:rRNA biogenesis protein RRP5
MEKVKNCLSRCLQAMPKHKHIKILSKYGVLLYKHNYIENARTILEGIVSNYPKR